MNQPHRVPEGRDGLANLAIAALVALAGTGAVLRAAGNLAALATAQPQPAGRLESGLQVLAHLEDPGVALGTPGLNPVAYWVCVTVLVAGLAAGSGWVWSRWREHTRRMHADPRRVVGTATKPEIVKTASAQALARRARVLRPSLTAPVPADVGYLIGHAHGQQVWASVEDSILVLGPPRSGKGWNLVINTILDAPGAVITT
ncbi:MAG: hypothetical protein LBK72_02215, partial [Bifidobacteriaceae bacterium]|nr:hypothetical protein [Bifidobacteriaceae bacterium]